MTQKIEADERTTRLVRPYLMDLNSTNGSFVNGSKIEPQRYVELLEKDVIRFGYSSREYVLLHDLSGAIYTIEQERRQVRRSTVPVSPLAARACAGARC